MFKRLLVNVILKRGAKIAEEALGKAVRHGMTIAGGALMQHGLADADEVTAMAGGAVALGGVVLSLLRIFVQKKIN